MKTDCQGFPFYLDFAIEVNARCNQGQLMVDSRKSLYVTAAPDSKTDCLRKTDRRPTNAAIIIDVRRDSCPSHYNCEEGHGYGIFGCVLARNGLKNILSEGFCSARNKTPTG